MAKTLVIDNGAWTLKAGVVHDGHVPEPCIIPNCLARDRSRKVYVGSELSQCRDYSEIQFRRPVDRGYLVNWEAQKEIWDRDVLGGQGGLGCDPRETRLLLSEQPNGLPVLQANCDQIVFEEYGFESYYRGIGPTFCTYHDLQSVFRTTRNAPTAAAVPADVALVVDAGYSFTTVTPLLRGRPLQSAIRRVDVGGKLLTNYLARLISLRHFDVRNEFHIVNAMKEQACFVSLDFAGDLERTWKGTRGERRAGYYHPERVGGGSGAAGSIVKDYVLPDFHTRHVGELRDYDPGRHGRKRRMLAPQGNRRGQGQGQGKGKGKGKGKGVEQEQEQEQEQEEEREREREREQDHEHEQGQAEGVAPHDDEDVLTLRSERFAVPELLFHPSDIGMREPGVAGAVMQSLRALPTGLWPALLANVVVVGGCALLEGFVERLRRDLVQLVPDECVVRVARPEDPVGFAWRGMAHLAGCGDVEGLVVTRAEYEEHGAGWVSRKFATGMAGS